MAIVYAAHGTVIEIPAVFAADRVYVTLRTGSGPLTLYTDSGGGSLIISRAAAVRLHLPLRPIDDPEAKAELGEDAVATIPPKLSLAVPGLPSRAFAVAHPSQVPGWPEQGDGFVGAKWFGGGVWTWDYARSRLWYRSSSEEKCGHAIPLGFKSKGGERPTNFARIGVIVDGREMQMLLDTGAETLLTDAARSAIGDGGPAFRATSMVAASEFDALHKLHPDWLFIERAQTGTGASMLRVPSVRIGDVTTGPVWFTRRSDAAYKNFMSSMMDRPVVGSIGGNAFHGLVLTVDFKRARAWIEHPRQSCFARLRSAAAASAATGSKNANSALGTGPTP